MTTQVMTAEDISKEVFNGKMSVRNIKERISKQEGFPAPLEGTGKLFWRRAEVYKFYGLQMKEAA